MRTRSLSLVLAATLATTASAQNLISNGGFESGTGSVPDDWVLSLSPSANNTIGRSTTAPVSGMYKGAVTTTVVSTTIMTSYDFRQTTAPGSVQPGLDYVVTYTTAYGPFQGPFPNNSASLTWLDAGGSVIAAEPLPASNGLRVTESTTLTAPAGADRCTLVIGGGFSPFTGAGTFCVDDVSIFAVNNACCLDDGSCVDVATRADCDALSGFYQLGSPCLLTACPTTGACCHPDGSCTEVSPLTCTFTGGSFQGVGTTCFTTVCVPVLGACCLADGTCVQTHQADCQSQGATAWSEGAACADIVCFGEPCLVELDGDGTPATVFDLLAFLQVWFPVSMGQPCP